MQDLICTLWDDLARPPGTSPQQHAVRSRAQTCVDGDEEAAESAAAGVVILREGSSGDRVYVIRHGRVAVTHDSRTIGTLTDGDIFGEIALIHDVPRTATATATTDSELACLDRDTFVAAISGHSESAEAANSTIAARLNELHTAFP